MKNIIFLLITILFSGIQLFAQGERRHIRDGNNDFAANNFSNSQVAYEKAITEDPRSFGAIFNLGDALYKQAQEMQKNNDQENAAKKFEEAAGQFQSLVSRNAKSEDIAKAYHNLGNSFLNANKVAESIDAYKSALKHNPADKASKYNLAYAQELQKQQQQQEQNQDQNKDQDQENKDKQDQQKDQDKKDQQDQKEQEKKQQEQDQDQQQQEQQQKQQQISKEDAERLLKALENDEKKVQDKVKKIKGQKIYIEKDW